MLQSVAEIWGVLTRLSDVSVVVTQPYVEWHTQEFCSGGCSLNSVEHRGQRERGSGGSSPLVRGSGGSYNFVQEISFHIVTFS
jgi:hypothetical protein